MDAKKLKPILIISYFFPPCSLTASQRVYSWAKWLNKFGYYPTIISRKWEENLKTLKDVSIPSSNGILHEKNEEYEVYYLPYKGNLRDRIYQKYGESKFRLLRQGLTFLELFLQYFYNKIIPYSNIYTFAKELMEKKKYEHLVISGNPFNLFKFGFQLNKKFGVNWTADYRDAWSTSEINDNSSSIFKRIIHKLDTHFEKKWIATASSLSASSGPIGKSIEELTGTKSFALYNGIAFEDFDVVKNKTKLPVFTITYIGTLYDGQKIEVFCSAYKKFIDELNGPKTQLLFPGLAFFGAQESRIQKAMKGYETYFSCSDRIPRKEILQLEQQAHLLLHVAWQGYKGIIASKIYEYIASGTKIIVAPSDNGAIEGIVKDSKCGVVFNEETKIVDYLKTEYADFLKNEYVQNDVSRSNVQQFSREKQVEEFVKQVLN
ncbi:hypothetical protein N9Q76_01305 [Flavobacteriales bacterium]|nr:hypothetical protein [Flavobacteriales bacterium]